MDSIEPQSFDTQLARLSAARTALRECQTIAAATDIRDIAVAAERYAEVKNLGEESVRYAKEIITQATRRIGELLPPKQPGPGRGHKEVQQDDSFTASTRAESKPGQISKRLATEARKLAAIPAPQFETALATLPNPTPAAIIKATLPEPAPNGKMTIEQARAILGASDEPTERAPAGKTAVTAVFDKAEIDRMDRSARAKGQTRSEWMTATGKRRLIVEFGPSASESSARSRPHA